MSRSTCLCLIFALLMLVASPHAWAIRPGRFIQSTESEFEPGENDNTIVTNLGDVELATGVKTLALPEEDVSVIYDLQVVGDVTYLAAGPHGKLLQRVGDQVTQVMAFPDEQVFCLSQYQGKLLLGLSGKTSRLAQLNDEGELDTVVELPDARYLWDIAWVDDGTAFPPVYVATGIKGTLYRVAVDDKGKPQATAILQAKQANLLTLSMPRADLLYVGTDTDGLIYRLTRQGAGDFESFVLYDAPEPEIATLLVLGDGTLYAGTADAKQARPGRLGDLVEEEVGRVSPDTALEQGQTPPDATPAPDDLPDVTPAPDPTAASIEPGPKTPATPAPQPPTARQANSPLSSDPASPSGQTEGQAPPSPPSAPSAEQHDRLRELVRQRLTAARKSGTLTPGSFKPSGHPSARPAKTAGGTSAGPQEGNAVYRIDPQGFVSEVFRESVMILNLVEDQGKLIVATGNEGQVFRVDPANHETTIIVDLQPEQVTALRATPQGVLLGTANPAQLLLLTGQTATTGTYAGPIMDASQVSLWGAMHLTAYIPDTSQVAVQTRSGNVEDPKQAPWSTWSDPVILNHDPEANALQPRPLSVKAPPARFLQYRLTLTGQEGHTPVVGRVETTYVTPNLRPQVSTFKAAYPQGETAQPGQETTLASPTLTVEWEASDPNDDALLFDVAYQPAGTKKWIELVSDLDALTYEWDTRRAPDGWYLLRVTATDKLNNPLDMAMTTTRRSAPILLDTTAPALEQVQSDVAPDLGTGPGAKRGSVTVSGIAVDAWSSIGAIAYAVDSDKFFEPILPTDLIFDSTREAWSVRIADLSPGPHVITLKVSDVRGNTGYRACIVNIAP